MAKKSIVPTAKSRTWENKVLLYDTDYNNKQLWLTIRLLVKDGNDAIRTPITALYSARFVEVESIKVSARNGLEPRQLELCYANPTDPTKESTLTVYVPYSANKAEWKAQIKETIDYGKPLNVTYKGETKNRDYEIII